MQTTHISLQQQMFSISSAYIASIDLAHKHLFSYDSDNKIL